MCSFIAFVTFWYYFEAEQLATDLVVLLDFSVPFIM